jgi:hypothetical protein
MEMEQQLVDGMKENLHDGNAQQPSLDTPSING